MRVGSNKEEKAGPIIKIVKTPWKSAPTIEPATLVERRPNIATKCKPLENPSLRLLFVIKSYFTKSSVKVVKITRTNT